MKRWMWLLVIVLSIGMVVAIIAHNYRTLQEQRRKNVLQTVIPVVVAPTQLDTLAADLELVGTIAPNNLVQVAAEATGRVEACSVALGRRVNRGDVLYILDDELRRAQLITAQANFDKARNDSIRYWFLKQKESVPDAQWEQVLLQYRLATAQLIQAQRAFNDTRIRAPISGIISAKRVDVGTMVNVGSIVCEIVDDSKLKVTVDVAERDIFMLHMGAPVEIRSDAVPGKVYMGRITAITPRASDAHTFPVEITIGPGAKELLPGMFVRVRFTDLTPAIGLTIPRDAIIGGVQQARVYVVDTASMTAHLRSVSCGIEAKGRVLIQKGLSPGEHVVVIGTNVLTDGAKVTVRTMERAQ